MTRFTKEILIIVVAVLAANCIVAQLENVETTGELNLDNALPTEAIIADNKDLTTELPNYGVDDESLLGEASTDGPLVLEPEVETANTEASPCVCDCGTNTNEAPCDSQSSGDAEPAGTTIASDQLEAEQSSTAAPEESSASPVVTESTAAPLPQSSSAAPEESSSSPDVTETTTTTTTSTTTTTTAAPAPQPCTVLGNTPHAQDCHSFWQCAASADGSLQQTAVTCPPNTAFSSVLSKCVRDISGCSDDGIVCSAASTFPDPQSNSSYYWCVPSMGGTIHKYHVQCRQGDIFHPLLEKCFMDIDNMQNVPPFYGMGPDDEDIIKVELKQFKQHDKLVMKEQKRKLKMEQKLQKELAKKAAKDAKKEAKSMGATNIESDNDDDVEDDD